MEAASTTEMLVNFYQTSWYNNPTESHLHISCHENLKSYQLLPMHIAYVNCLKPVLSVPFLYLCLLSFNVSLITVLVFDISFEYCVGRHTVAIKLPVEHISTHILCHMRNWESVLPLRMWPFTHDEMCLNCLWAYLQSLQVFWIPCLDSKRKGLDWIYVDHELQFSKLYI